ncbi:hypothetical protein ACFS7Z_15055 [Pontibacter toksunensis]|uniref:Uncharacterized protein n=1 Tax=Pontibacter toksunensis TaxID=1332631 RepID=A0ABW6BXK4_9BACT
MAEKTLIEPPLTILSNPVSPKSNYGSYVSGLDEDDADVFKRTVDWGVKNSITTSTYHVLTPYPGTKLYEDMEQQGRILTRNWDLYDTRNVVYQTTNLTADELKNGYDWAYKEFYSWSNVFKSSFNHQSHKHFFYTGGWKKFEPVWNFLIKTNSLNNMLPVLESILSEIKAKDKELTTEKEEQLQPTMYM